MLNWVISTACYVIYFAFSQETNITHVRILYFVKKDGEKFHLSSHGVHLLMNVLKSTVHLRDFNEPELYFSS